MSAKLLMELTMGEQTGASIADRLPSTDAPQIAANALASLLVGTASGQFRGRLRVAIDESAGVAASGTATCVVASLIAGDQLLVDDVIFSCVTGAAVAAAGQYSKDTSNTACGISLAAAINAHPATKGRFIATESNGTVTITARLKGEGGNLVKLRKNVTTAAGHVLSGATLSGGIAPSGKRSRTATLSDVWTADNTFSIGGVVLTAKADPSGESEFALGTVTEESAAASLAACINAHSKLAGIVSASTGGTAVCTITLLVSGRIGELITLAETGTVCTLSATNFAPTTTDTTVQAVTEYALGA